MTNFLSRHTFRLPSHLMTAALLCILSPVAQAGTVSSNITVSATVLSACLLGSSTLAFGNYDPTSSSPTTGSTSVIATCTQAASYSIALSDGAGSGAAATGGAAGRKMTQVLGTTTLGYNLYQDANYTTAWGSGASNYVTNTGTGLPQTFTVYGRIPAQQAASAGAYLDTVTATLTF